MGVPIKSTLQVHEVLSHNKVKMSDVTTECAARREKDPRALDGMSPRQEKINAISMSAPSLVVSIFFFFPPNDSYWSNTWRMSILTVPVLLHLPVSMSYHFQLAWRVLKHSVDCNPRRLDQTFVHLASIGTSIGLSTDITWSAVCCLFNIYFIRRLWTKKEAQVLERMVNIGIAVLLYGIPVLARGDIWHFVGGASFFLSGAVAMLLRFGGWGHTVMHIMLGGIYYNVMRAAEVMQSSQSL